MKLLAKYMFFFLLTSQNGYTKDYKVASIEEFNASVSLLKPGDRIILQNGTWENVNFEFKAYGEKGNPIILEAETPGKVLITGNSSLKLAGEYLEINGLWFKNGFTSEKSVISFRTDSREHARNSRVTNCAVTDFNPMEDTTQYFYLELWGRDNRVDHNYFEGKTNQGPTLVVWLTEEAHRQNDHLIDSNFFGERPALGRNGGETIRIGTSHNSIYASSTTVESNVFVRCNGEAEIISNKSGNNCFRSNLFLESEGSLTLRHGNNALVENNVFLGNGKDRTGGVRIINEGHIVRNNLFVSLRGEDLKSPLVIMNGVPNSPLNRYHQVKNVEVQFNTFIDCSPLQFGAGKDEERTLAPVETLVANNLFLNMAKEPFLLPHDELSGISFRNNKTNSTAVKQRNWVEQIDIETTLVNGIPVPEKESEELKAEILSEDTPEKDISGHPRIEVYVGAINPGVPFDADALELEAGPNWRELLNEKITHSNN